MRGSSYCLSLLGIFLSTSQAFIFSPASTSKSSGDARTSPAYLRRTKLTRPGLDAGSLSRLNGDADDPLEEDSRPETMTSPSSRRRCLLASALYASTLLSQLQAARAYTDDEGKRIAIFERTAPSVVFIDTFVERRDVFSTNIMEVPLGSGSGFVWDTDGHIVTNFHVVRNAAAAQVAILTDGKSVPAAALPPSDAASAIFGPPTGGASSSSSSSELVTTTMRPSNQKRSVFKATVVGVDPSKDVAVLKVNAPKSLLRPIVVGTSAGLKVGQQALAIGNPFGLDHTLTAGIISGTGRQVTSPSGRPISNVIQSDAAINPGNSGGPLLDSNGKLIGMNTAIYSPSGASAGIGFAIPIDTVKYIVDTLIRDGKVVRPVLGISFLESRQARALGIGSGVLVLEVPENSPAAQAGLKGTRRTAEGLVELGDIISRVGTKIIDSEADLFQALEDYQPGDVVQLTVSRVTNDGDQMSIREIVLQVKLQSSADLEKNVPSFQYQTQ